MKSIIEFFRVKNLPDIELYRGVNVNPVSRHIHCMFSLSVWENGVGTHITKQGKHHITPGGIVIVNIGDAHSTDIPGGYNYTSSSLRIEPELLEALIQQVTGKNNQVLHFSQPVIYNQIISSQILKLNQIIRESGSSLETECLLFDIFAQLFEYAGETIKYTYPGKEHKSIARVCEYLQECFDESVSLNYLAEIAGLSPFHLSRVFAKEVGVPPHAYQLQVRLKKATDLLASGKPLADVAYETGFCDQSHFQKSFKKKFRITPGHYKVGIP